MVIVLLETNMSVRRVWGDKRKNTEEERGSNGCLNGPNRKCKSQSTVESNEYEIFSSCDLARK